MLSDLTKNIEKIHTTEMGVERIKKNLNLLTDDVVSWCKTAVKNAEIIMRHGKNWHVYVGGNVITVNAKSYTIITAHKIKAKIRIMQKEDFECLEEFLYQAVYVPKGEKMPPRDLIFDEQIYIYIKDFGKKPSDLGVIAEVNGQIVGAAWVRIIPAYGHLNDTTPELAISLFPEFRGYGIGSRLMEKLFAVLRENGYKQTSLSVQTDNPAVNFYKRLGYKIVSQRPDGAGHEDYLMVKDLL